MPHLDVAVGVACGEDRAAADVVPDWLEAVVAVPDQLFYNADISTDF